MAHILATVVVEQRLHGTNRAYASLGGSKRSYCYCHRLLAGTVCSPTDTLPAYANKKHTVCKLDSR